VERVHQEILLLQVLHKEMLEEMEHHVIQLELLVVEVVHVLLVLMRLLLLEQVEQVEQV
jgi:hypothetical protein